ncbi:MAG TPA: UDP-N-acetylmuramate dehydrogenase [bacterium]|nr:UDP-N-acetylmuramate dehydrogenase [bacterium]
MSVRPLALEEELRRRARDVRPGEPLWRHVSMRIGGPADLLVIPRALEELRQTARFLFDRRIPFITLGQGSNVLIADAGIRGVVVKVGKGTDRTRFDGSRVAAEAGLGLPYLAQEAARRGLAGLEFAAGIPASVGGAVVMNAGAHGHAMSEVTVRARVIGPEGERDLDRSGLEFAYRTSALQGQPAVVLEVEVELTAAPAVEVRQRMDTWLAQRNATQPIGPPSSGCVFRNPDGDHAGRLIDLAGCKGMAVGDAVVSEIHANYIVNRDRATAANVLALIERVRARVRERAGRQLELEIKVLGEI